MIIEEIARERAAAKAFVEAVARGDLQELGNALDVLQYSIHGYGRRAFRAAARLRAPVKARRAFLELWQRHGDGLRGWAPSDFLLIDFLRAVLPPYSGPRRRLYRGEGAFNRRHRTYGLSWSTEVDIARQHAENNCSKYNGGAVLLQADVPARAIFCAPHETSRSWGEREYMVDRRLLGAVKVLERFPPRRLEVRGSTGSQKRGGPDKAAP